LIPTLERNRDLNGCRFGVKHAALGYDAHLVDFHAGLTFLSGSVWPVSERTSRVPTTTLETILDEADFQTASLVADIEGSEGCLVEREPAVLRTHPVVQTRVAPSPSRIGWHPTAVRAAPIDRLSGTGARWLCRGFRKPERC
jgi:hypothetical protein